MEKIMSKSNDTSRPATLEDHDTLADTELDVVTGAWNAVEHGAGGKGNGSGSWLEALAIAMGQAMNARL
jgi:hypothetical protein